MAWVRHSQCAPALFGLADINWLCTTHTLCGVKSLVDEANL